MMTLSSNVSTKVMIMANSADVIISSWHHKLEQRKITFQQRLFSYC